MWQVNQMISENYSQIKELIRLRDWLIPMIMNGQVTFKTEEYTKEDDFLVEHFT